VWSGILGDRLHRVLLLKIASEAPSLIYLARLDLTERILSEQGHQVRRVSIHELGKHRSGLARAQTSCVVIAAERPQIPSAGEDDAGRGMSALWELHQSGALLIAGATAAAGSGEICLWPEKPFPKSPSEMDVALVPGLGLLRRTIVLPYFEHLDASLVEQVRQRASPDTCLIGIDENAALNISTTGVRCVGLGKVTLLRDNGIKWVGSDGDTLPTDLFSPGSQR
jgi:hypothetical protein